MKKLTNKQSNIIADIKDSIATDIEVLEGFIEEGRKDMVSHMQGSIGENLSGISSYLIFSDNTKGNKNWKAIKEEFYAIQNMDVLNIHVWLDLVASDKSVSEEEYKLANA